MSVYLTVAYLHIVSVIFWIGSTLFWLLIIPPLRSEYDVKGGSDLIDKMENSMWPPVSIPSPVRLRFLHLDWVIMTFAVVTGFILLYLRGFTVQEITSGEMLQDGLGVLGIAKVVLVAMMVLIQFLFKTRKVIQVRLVFFISLFVAGISVLLVR